MVSCCLSHAIWYSKFLCIVFSIIVTNHFVLKHSIFFCSHIPHFPSIITFHLLICGTDTTTMLMLPLSLPPSSSSLYGKVIILSHYVYGIIGFFSLLISIWANGSNSCENSQTKNGEYKLGVCRRTDKCAYYMLVFTVSNKRQSKYKKNKKIATMRDREAKKIADA